MLYSLTSFGQTEKLSAPSVYTLGGAYIDLVLYSGIGRPGEG